MNQPFVMHSGEQKILRFTIADLDQPKDPVTGLYPPMNLTGYTARWALARGSAQNWNVGSVLFKDAIVADAPNGIILVMLDEGETDEFEGSFHQQVRIFETAASDAPSVVFEGPVFIKRTQLDA